MFIFIYVQRDWDCVPNHERLIVFNGIEQPQRREIKFSDVSLVNGNLMTIRSNIYMYIQDCSLRDVRKIDTDKEERTEKREKKGVEIWRI